MKLKIYDDAGNEKYLNVDYKSFMKCDFLVNIGYIIIYLSLVVVLVVLGVVLGIVMGGA